MFKQGKISQSLLTGIDKRDELLVKLEKILSHKGFVSLSSYEPNYVRRRIFSRIRSLKIDSMDNNIEFLEKHPEEGEKLMNALPISFTSFFRDPETFQALSKIALPDIFKFAISHKREIRALSAGCATGEETYSLAMTFLEHKSDAMKNVQIHIWGTDMDENAINFCKRGVYQKSSFDGIHPYLVQKYFRKGPEGYQIRQMIKEIVSFKRDNILAQAGTTFETLDLIMCRNLLIYLDVAEQRRLLFKFDRWLRPGGYLVLGKTEFMLDPFRASYEAVSSRERIYRKPLTARSADTGGEYEG